MPEVMGVFFAQGDVGADTAVQVVIRMRSEYNAQGVRQACQVVENPAAGLQVNTDAPCQGFGRENQYDKYR